MSQQRQTIRELLGSDYYKLSPASVQAISCYDAKERVRKDGLVLANRKWRLKKKGLN